MIHQKVSSNRRAKSALLVLGAAALLQGAVTSATAAPAYGLYNTGIDTTAMLLSDGTLAQIDQAYTIALEGGTIPSTMYVTDLGTFPNALPYSPPDDDISSFISPQVSYANGQVDAGGIYDISTTFNLTIADLSTISLYGSFESDDRISDILLNGNSLGIALSDPDYKGFSDFYNLANNNFLVAGVNTLTFQVTNLPNSSVDPVALRAVFSPVPEPSTWASVGVLSAVMVFGGWLRRRRATV